MRSRHSTPGACIALSAGEKRGERKEPEHWALNFPLLPFFSFLSVAAGHACGYGLSILQFVGNTVSLYSVRMSVFQPKPVPSASIRTSLPPALVKVAR